MMPGNSLRDNGFMTSVHKQDDELISTGDCRVKDFALSIIEMEEDRPSGVPKHYFSEICMNIGGQIVNAEMVVTFANGKPCGKQYIPDSDHNSKPNENETVWFRVDDGRAVINCMVNNLAGWRLGWWSGSRWHSYHDKEIDEASVVEWKPLGLSK